MTAIPKLPSPYSLVLVSRWTCSVCGKVEESEQHLGIGYSLAGPYQINAAWLPPCWHEIWGRVFCSDHEIKVMVDGEQRLYQSKADPAYLEQIE